MKATLCTAVLAVLLLAPGAAPATGAGTPALRLLDRAPLTVSGSNFKPGELVRVTASVEDESVTRAVHAGPGGGFTVRFLTVTPGTCADFSIVAGGTTGTRAALKLLPPAACQPLSEPSAALAVTERPRLRVLDPAPLVVRGSGFEAREIVRVVYRRQGVLRRTATATAAGTFVVRFPVAWQLCPPASLTATGSKGSLAAVKTPRTMCPQPPSEP